MKTQNRRALVVPCSVCGYRKGKGCGCSRKAKYLERVHKLSRRLAPNGGMVVGVYGIELFYGCNGRIAAAWRL